MRIGQMTENLLRLMQCKFDREEKHIDQVLFVVKEQTNS